MVGSAKLLFSFFLCVLCVSALVPFFPFITKVHFAQENSMSAEAARRAPLMPLRELVRMYRSHANNFGEPVVLSVFGLTAQETERLFSSYDEDYHISRFFHFSEAAGQKFSINGIPATHVSLDAEIETIL
jgi:hypothetical protein